MTLGELSELIQEADAVFTMRRTARGIYLGMAKNNMSHRIDNIIDGVEVRQAELLLNEETLIDIRVERMAEEMRNITQIHDTDDTPLTA